MYSFKELRASIPPKTRVKKSVPTIVSHKIEEIPESRMMEIHEVSPGYTIEIGVFKASFIHQ